MRSIHLRDIISFLLFLVVPIVAMHAFLENEAFLKENFPPLVNAQLWWHQFVSRPIPLASVRRPRTKWVALAEVDDTAFWNPPLSGIQPTNRRFIADIAKNAADAGAALIALDFKLKSPNDKVGDDPVRADDNRYLFASLAQIANTGTPVVLGCGFVRDAGGAWKEEPNIVDDRRLPALEGFGYINLPEDPRQLPLWQDARLPDNSSTEKFDSFALRIVNRFEELTNIAPRTAQNWTIQTATNLGEFVYGGFLPTSEFLKIPAEKLAKGDPDAKRLCRDKIVIVGATWHQDGGRGDLIDGHLSPIGFVPGVYLHANYVESLLDDRYALALPWHYSLPLELIFGLLLYVSYHWTRGTTAAIAVLAVFFIPFAIGYFLLANLGVYFDSILSLIPSFIHLGIDYIRHE